MSFSASSRLSIKEFVISMARLMEKSIGSHTRNAAILHGSRQIWLVKESFSQE